MVEPSDFGVLEYAKSVGLNFLLSVSSLLLIHLASLASPLFEIGSGQRVQQLDAFSPLILIAVGGVLAPIAEELVFRLPQSLTYRNAVVALLCGCLLLAFLSTSAVAGKAEPARISLIAIGIGLVLIIWSIKKYAPALAHTAAVSARSQFRFLVYGSCLLFALGHAGFQANAMSVITSLVNTTPQLVAGLFYSFLRNNYGIRSSILCHVTTNSVLMLFLALVD
jgi:membrane protease YdiL (CAAX protease family)